MARFLFVLWLGLTLAACADNPFDYSTPERTWATFKFALDTNDLELFRNCFDPGSDDYPYLDEDSFLKFLSGDGQYARSSRVKDCKIKGEEATLSVDFFSFERGKPFHDNDPITLKRVEGKWLLTGI